MTTITTNNSAPGPILNALQNNYMSRYDFTTKFHPELIPELVELFGRGILGFSRLYGAKMGVSADQVYWAESGRLRKIEKGVELVEATGVFTCQDDTIQRVGAMIYVLNPVNGKKQPGRVVEVSTANKKQFTALPYDAASWNVGTEGLNVITIGSEFKKGTTGMKGSLVSQEDIYHTSLTISKDNFLMNDSDIANVTWVQAPDGKFFWFNSEVEKFYQRFDEYEELKLVASTQIDGASPLFTDGYNATSGLFESIEKRGSIMTGIPSSLNDVEDMIKVLDKEEGEKANALFFNTEASISVDKMLAQENVDKGGAGWGSFENKETFIKFGFDGWAFGGYEFYKKTWSLLNDPTGLSVENTGPAGAIHGILMPLGTVRTKTGYNSELSGGTSQPIRYLTLIYKEGNGISRDRSTHFYGRRFGDSTLDATGVDILSENGMILAGANKWMIFEG